MGLLICLIQIQKAALLLELLGAFPTKAVNDTALKESLFVLDSFAEAGFFLKKASAFKAFMELTIPCCSL